jgi:hypothetical protein
LKIQCFSKKLDFFNNKIMIELSTKPPSQQTKKWQ